MIFFNPQQLLEALGVVATAPIYSWVAGLLLIKLWIIFFLSSFVIVKKAQRLWNRHRNHLREAEYRAFVHDYARSLSTESQRKSLEQVLAVRLRSKMERGFFRRVLLEELSQLDRGGRAHINRLYSKLGYLEADLRALSSKLWWHRLSSIIRLEQLQNPKLEQSLTEMTADPNDLVAISAMRALGAIGNPDSLQMIMDEISRRMPSRRDLYIEILSQFGEEGSERIIEYIQECYDPFVAAIGLEVLARLQVRSAVPLCLHLLRSSSDEVVVSAISALRKFKTPAAIPVLKELLSSDSEIVRAHSVVALSALNEPKFKNELNRLADDKSVEVRRAIHSALSEEDQV